MTEVKKPFDEYVQGVSDEDLNKPLEPSIDPEAEWILSQCAERGTTRSDDFDGSLSLSSDEVSAEQRVSLTVRQEVLAWSKRGEVVTLRRLLQALYDRDRDELVEGICQGEYDRQLLSQTSCAK